MFVKWQFFLISHLASVSQTLYYDNLALYDDRTLVIRLTMYECIFVMLTEHRTAGGA